MNTESITDSILKFKDEIYTPEQMAAILYASVLCEDDVLDFLKAYGDNLGYERRLNRVGVVYMAMVAEVEGVFA